MISFYSFQAYLLGVYGYNSYAYGKLGDTVLIEIYFILISAINIFV